ncbi:MAG: hypothetical protein U0798_12595 [Gemmataceae bacterium]
MRKLLGFLAIGLIASSTPAIAQEKGTYRTVEPFQVPFDKPDTITMHFGYYPVRIAEVNVPGRGKQTVWYMLFEVWNKTGTPQQIVPEFTIVSKDLDLPGSWNDEPLPSVVKQIIEIEDKNKNRNIHSTTSITEKKIPVTKPDSFPNSVTGVAVWTNVPAKAANLNKFSVYITGLSNGLIETDAGDGSKVVRRKTLQLDFVKPTDNKNVKMDDIKIDDNNGIGNAKWYYRASTYKKAEAPANPKP